MQTRASDVSKDLSARAAHFILAGMVLLVGSTIGWFGIHDYYHWGDEDITVFGARQLEAGFPSSIWDWHFSARPFERLSAWMFALARFVTPTSTGSFQLAHFLQGAIWAAAILPVYRLARLSGLKRSWSLFAAGFAVVGPWTVIAVSLLNNAPGMTTTAILLLVAWGALTTPSWRRDLGVLFAALLVGIARSGNIQFIAAVYPALLVIALRDAWGGGLLTWPFRAARIALGRHFVLLGVGAVAGAVLLVRGAEGLLGGYGGTRGLRYPTDLFTGNWHVLMSHTVIAVGAPAAILAMSWLVRETFSPRSRQTWILALLTVSLTFIFFYSYAGSMNEDRYFVVLAPMVALAAAHALSDPRAPSLWLTGLVGLLVYRAIDGGGFAWPDNGDTYYIAPSAQWWNRVIEGRLSSLPLIGSHHEFLGYVGVVGVAVAFVILACTRWRTGATWLVVAGVIGLQAAGAIYTMNSWTRESRTVQLRSLKDASWIDAADVEEVYVLAQNPTEDVWVAELQWRQQMYWNDSVVGVIPVSKESPGLTVNSRDGRVALNGFPTPRYLVTSTSPDFGLAGEVVIRHPVWPLRLERPNRPWRASYVVLPGRLRGVALRLRVFPRTTGTDVCLKGLTVDAAHAGRWRWQVTDGGSTKADGRFSVKLPDRDNVIVSLSALSGGGADSVDSPPAVYDLLVEDC